MLFVKPSLPLYLPVKLLYNVPGGDAGGAGARHREDVVGDPAAESGDLLPTPDIACCVGTLFHDFIDYIHYTGV